jgi:hypothetical protein
VSRFYFTVFLLLLLKAQVFAQIPGTVAVSAPVAPPATNSPFGATDTRWSKGGYGTWATNLAQLQSLTWLPAARRQAGMVQQLQGGSKYVLAPDLVTWIPQFLNAKDFGATGDGTTDDSAALFSLAQAATNGSTVYYPSGTYRLTTAGADCFWRTNLQNLSLIAEAGAEFVMANNTNGVASGDGFRLTGPATNFVFSNLRVRWETQPTNRAVSSQHVGIGVDNPNGQAGTGLIPLIDTTPTGWGRVENCQVAQGPGLAFYFTGIDTLFLNNNTVNQTLADGFYIRVSRNILALNNRVNFPGDDAFSITRYEDNLTNATLLDKYHGEGSVVIGLSVNGVYSNAISYPAGVWLGGTRDVLYSGISVTNFPIGVRVYTGSDRVASSNGYPTLAAKGTTFRNFNFVGVTQAFGLQLTTNSFAAGVSSDPKWRDNDITIADGTVSGTNVNLFVSTMWDLGITGPNLDPTLTRMISGVTFRNITDNENFGKFSAIYGGTNITIDNLITASRVYLTGPKYDSTAIAKASLPYQGWIIKNSQFGSLGLQGVNGVNIENVMSHYSPGLGFDWQNVYNVVAGRIVAKDSQQSSEGPYAIYIRDSENFSIDSATIDQSNVNLGYGLWETNNLGGTLKSWTWMGNQWQANLYAAYIDPTAVTNLNVSQVRYFNKNETNAVWHTYNYLNSLGIGRLATNDMTLDVNGIARISGQFAQYWMNDTNQYTSQGYNTNGLMRVVADSGYGGSYIFAFNAATNNDFTSERRVMRVSKGDSTVLGAILPGSSNVVDIGNAELPFSRLFSARLVGQSQATAPTTNQVTDSSYQVYWNTVDQTYYLWANKANILFSTPIPLNGSFRANQYGGIGFSRDATAGFLLDVGGPIKNESAYAQYWSKDSNQSVSAGGLMRLIGDTAYSGGYNFQFNTAAGGDFSSAINLIRLLPAYPMLAPGSDNAVDLGSSASSLWWRNGFVKNVYAGTQLVVGANGTAVKSIRMGRATLVAGTVVVSDSTVTTSSKITLGRYTPGGTLGNLDTGTRVASTSFTITSSSVLETSVIDWVMYEP